MTTTEKSLHRTLLELVDQAGEIDFMVEKLQILADDLYSNHISRINLKTERGKLTAESDLNIAYVKSEVLCDYMNKAVNMCERMLELSNSAFTYVKKEQQAM